MGTPMAGPYLIQKVVRLAVDVFRRPARNEPFFRDGLAQLTQLVNQLSAQDVCFDQKWVNDTRPYRPSLGVAPMTYVRLYENDHVSIGIFILRHGFRLPMHDHPNMYGVLKVLHGKILMQSYTRVPPTDGVLNGVRAPGGGATAAGWDTRQTRLGTIYHTVKEAAERVGATDPPRLLTPDKANIHEITAVDGPAAFLDILAPPYDDKEHVYHNFKELSPQAVQQLTAGELNTPGWLIRVRDNSFYSDSAPYKGPPLDDIR